MKGIDKSSGEIFNLGTGYTANQAQVVAEILKYFPHLRAEIRPPLPYMKKEIPSNLISCVKFRRQFNWSPKTDLSKGVELTVRWWMDNASVLSGNMSSSAVSAQ
jgi:nucleoside-diphosphate-sugar epimerase